MFFKHADNRNPDSLASRMRRKRTEWLKDLLLRFPEPVRILDVGGTPEFWLGNAPDLGRKCRLTLLNLGASDVSGLTDAVSIAGDARKMPEFANHSFDVCFSNSVIEHVGTLYDQMAMAAEVRRVAKSWFIQTPNRFFPLEPHFLFPCWQFLPVWLRARLLAARRWGWMPQVPDPVRSRAEVEQIRLLSYGEMRTLFPEGEIRRETLGPLTKSLIAIQRCSEG